MRRLLIIVALLLGLVAAGVGAVLMTVPAALAAPSRPNPQVEDGLYKSLVVALPGGRVLVCILTRLPLSLPHYTIPPEYMCVKAPGSS